jgi:hypothetical protein
MSAARMPSLGATGATSRGAARAPGERRARSRWLIALDVFSLSLASALTLLAWSRIEAWPSLSWLPLLALAALCGWAFADFGSGLVHFLCDRFGSERTPVLGPAVIRPFREHHVDPRAITAHGFVELSGNNALALAPMLALGSELAPFFGETLWHSAAFSWLMSASAGLFTTNQIHRWAHMACPPRLARALQRLRIAIRAEQHAVHHRGEHDVAYCITNGWCNALLDRARFWPRLARALGGARRARAAEHA